MERHRINPCGPHLRFSLTAQWQDNSAEPRVCRLFSAAFSLVRCFSNTTTFQFARAALGSGLQSFVRPPPSPSFLLIYVPFLPHLYTYIYSALFWCCFSFLFFLFPG